MVVVVGVRSKGLGDWVHNLVVKGKGKIMKYGLYTSRGVNQCDTAEYKLRCMHNPPNPATRCEGSNGYEASRKSPLATENLLENT